MAAIVLAAMLAAFVLGSAPAQSDSQSAPQSSPFPGAANTRAARSGRPEPKPYALIFGTVWDPDGHPLYGIKVNVRLAQDKPKKVRWQLYSDHSGEFAQRVPAGKADYVVWADVKGYKSPSGKKPIPASEVSVHIDDDERSDIGLHLDWQ